LPRGTGTPNSLRTVLAWYSWMFIAFLVSGQLSVVSRPRNC
jgi:hypothetical protein